MRYFIVLALYSLLAIGISVSFAQEAAAPAPSPAAESTAGNLKAVRSSADQKCRMREEGTVNINFNDSETDVQKVKPAIDAKIQEVMDLSKGAGIEVEIQSMNYGANSNSYGCGDSASRGSYQINGSFSLKVRPSDKAAALTAILAQKGYNASFNVNAYRQCGGDFEGE